MKLENPNLAFVASMLQDKGVQLTNFVEENKFHKDRMKFEFKLSDEREMGIYAFWWNGPLKKSKPIPSIEVTAPGGEAIKLQWRESDFPEECHAPPKYPLYIGKTTTFVNRIHDHLHITKNWKDPIYKPKKVGEVNRTEIFPNEYRLRKHSTSCQFRSGLEHLLGYPQKKVLIKELENVTLSFFSFPKVLQDIRTDASERFYLEDLAIGYFRPWFNVDSER